MIDEEAWGELRSAVHEHDVRMAVITLYSVSEEQKATAIGYVLDHMDGEDFAEGFRPEFVEAMNELTRPWGVEVVAPLMGSSKAEIMSELEGTPVHGLTWSCYAKGKTPCGVCASCVARSEAEGD